MFIYSIFIAGFFIVIDGSQNIQFRIGGGNVASISSYPYVVSIQHPGYVNNQYCTGSIISEDIILTAGHCIPDNFHELKVRTNSNFSLIGGSIYEVDSFIRHENYKDYQNHAINDVALIKVKSPFGFNNVLRPIPMVDDGAKIPPASYGVALGWGEVPQNEKNQSSSRDRRYNQLRKVALRIPDYSTSNKLQKDIIEDLSPGEFCAGINRNGKGVRRGDSGGPLVFNGKVAGVASWAGIFRDLSFSFSVYAEVAYFRKWIDENMSKLSKRN